MRKLCAVLMSFSDWSKKCLADNQGIATKCKIILGTESNIVLLSGTINHNQS